MTSEAASTSTYQQTGGIGIDLGTSNSCVYFQPPKQNPRCILNGAERTTPSVVSFGNETLVGRRAVNQLNRKTSCVVSKVKYVIGKKNSQLSEEQKKQIADIVNVPVDFTNPDDCPRLTVKEGSETKQMRPETISGIVLKHLIGCVKDELKMPDDYQPQCVISVPARFTNAERMATQDAAKIAGIKCLRIINEPTAAVIDCINKGILPEPAENDSHKVMVIDLGGGTSDITIATQNPDMVVEVVHTDGDVMLGGTDFTNMVMNNLIDRFCEVNGSAYTPALIKKDKSAMKKFLVAAENAKIDVNTRGMDRSGVELVEVFDGLDFSYDYTLSQFNKQVKPLLEKVFTIIDRIMNKAGLSFSQLHQIVLVGGSCRIKEIYQGLLNRQVPDNRINTQLNFDEAVAEGACYMANVIGQYSQDDTNHLLLIDSIPMNINIRTMEDTATPLLEAGKSIPCKVTQTFTTQQHNQSGVTIHISEGQSPLASRNHALGQFELTNIEKAPRGVPQIEVTFHVDVNSILTVSAKDKKTGVSHSLNVSNNRMTPDQINAAKEQHAQNDEKERKIAELLQKKSVTMNAVEDITDRIENLKEHPKFSEVSSMLQNYRMQLIGLNTSNIDAQTPEFFDNMLNDIQSNEGVKEIMQAAGAAGGPQGAPQAAGVPEPTVEEAD